MIEVVLKPWGEERIWALALGKYCGKRLYVNGGCRLSMQYHTRKEETLMLESGEACLFIGESLELLERINLVVGEPIHIEPQVIHRLCAITDSVVLEVSTTELDDVVRLDDDYNR